MIPVFHLFRLALGFRGLLNISAVRLRGLKQCRFY